jgi:hypothetical protein
MALMPDNAFLEASRAVRQRTVLGELWQFLRSTRKYWLAPIFLIAVLIGILAVLSSSAAAPFIYSLF